MIIDTTYDVITIIFDIGTIKYNILFIKGTMPMKKVWIL